MFLVERGKRKGLLIQTDKYKGFDENEKEKSPYLDESVFFYDMDKSRVIEEDNN